MKTNALNGYQKLKKLYENHITVDLLAEEIKTCRPDEDASVIKKAMSEHDFDIFGVKMEEKIIGYIIRNEIHKDGFVSDFFKEFHAEDLISDSTSILELLVIFQEREFIFILEKNRVTKIVTVSDLQKQPIRMLAFSLISILEIYLLSLIQQQYPDGRWIGKLSESRVNQARRLLQERLEKNQALTLLDNLQLSDKGTIVRKTPELVEMLGFGSNTQCKEFFRNIEELRNNTAHSQEQIYHDYRELIAILLQIESVLSRSL